MDCLCRSHSVLSATDWPFHPPPKASDAPLLLQLISPLVRGLPQMWEPLHCFSSTPGAQILPCFLFSSFSLLSFIPPGYAGIFLVLSSAQGLLLVFSWCSVRVVPSANVFLMHLWREMNSTSSYSSAILVSLYICHLNFFCSLVSLLFLSFTSGFQALNLAVGPEGK